MATAYVTHRASHCDWSGSSMNLYYNGFGEPTIHVQREALSTYGSQFGCRLDDGCAVEC